MIGELLALSQTKEMEVFVTLMGVNGDHGGATELEILVRMMYFFNPSKPYGFSPDIKISYYSLKTHLHIIVDNVIDKEIVENILGRFTDD